MASERLDGQLSPSLELGPSKGDRTPQMSADGGVRRPPKLTDQGFEA